MRCRFESGTKKNGASLGFSLIELLVVLAITNILLAILLPALQGAREKARQTRCQANLRSVVQALHHYHDVHSTFPIANLPYRHWSWQAAVLPYLERGDIYDRINYSDGWATCWQSLASNLDNPESPGNRVVPAFLCPSDPLAGKQAAPTSLRRANITISFLGVSGSQIKVPGSCGSLDASRDGMMFAHFLSPTDPACHRFYPNVPTRMRDVVDGTSRTAFVGERGLSRTSDGYTELGWLLCGTGYNNAGEGDHVLSLGGGFHYPDRSNGERHFWSHHPGGGHFAAVDGSVSYYSYSTAASVLRSLATRAGGD